MKIVAECQKYLDDYSNGHRPPFSTDLEFVWSTLVNGNPAYTVVQVATIDLIILVAFVPIVKFLLGVSNVSVPYSTLFASIFLFVVIPKDVYLPHMRQVDVFF